MAENRWGPINGIDSNDYEFMMEGAAGVTDRPISIVGHALTNPAQELADALQFTDVELKSGKIVQVRRTKRPAREIGRTYTIGFPSALWTPALARSWRGTDCRTTFFLKYTCPEDERFLHAYILPKATMNPPVESGDFITTEDDTAIVKQTSEIQVDRRLVLWNLGSELLKTVASTALLDVVFLTEDCAGCDFVAGQGAIVVGGDGIVSGYAHVSTDRFSSSTSIVPGFAAADYAHAVYTDGDLVIIAGNDEALITTTPTGNGKMYVSVNGGTSWTTVTDIVTPSIYDIQSWGGSTLIAVGAEITTGAGIIYVSFDNGNNWTAITSSAIPATALYAAKYDASTGRMYIVGDTGVLLVASLNGTTVTISDISANLDGAPGDLFAVAVLDDDYIAVGGASGYYCESDDGMTTSGEVAVGTTDPIMGIDGNLYRTMVGAGEMLFERTIFSDNQFSGVTLQNAAAYAGDIQKVAMAPEGDFNLFIAVSDEGQIIISKPFYPNS